MKKFLRVAAVALGLLLVASSAEAKIIRFGVKAGANISELSLNKGLEQVADADNNCGWNAGVMTELQVPIVGICADVAVMYSRLNQKVDPTANASEFVDENMPKSFGNDFLEIPVHLKYKFNLPVVSNLVTPYLLTGPAFAFNLNKKTFDDIKNRKCQTSWDFGVGVELFSHLQISGQYCLGMNNLAKYWGELNPTGGVKVKNNYWNVSAAWLF